MTVSISCDPTTYLWNVSELSPVAPPPLCNFTVTADMLVNVPDMYKPCALWFIMYGGNATAVPTMESSAFSATSGTGTYYHTEWMDGWMDG